MRLAPVIGVLVLFAAACDKPTEAPAAPAAEPAALATPSLTAPSVSSAATPLVEAIGKFDPAKQHLVWVLPEGVHGAGPWEMDVTVKHKGDVKYQTAIPLAAEIKPGGARPEYPASTEVVRLSGDARYGAEMAKVYKVIDDLIAKFGRGDGELEMVSELKTKIAPEYRNAYCVEGRKPVVLAFIDQDDPPQLIPLELGPMAPIFEASIFKNCKSPPT
jgi:hypothetical protein